MNKDSNHPWFRPLWRRVAVVAFCVAWAIFEFATGTPFWGVMALGFRRIWHLAILHHLRCVGALAADCRVGNGHRKGVKPCRNCLLKAKPGPGSCGACHSRKCGLDLCRFRSASGGAGQYGLRADSEDKEVCLVFVTGKGVVTVNGRDLGLLGERMSPFEGKPWSVYVPEGCDWSVTADTPLELAVCSAPGLGGGLPVRVISPDDLGQETRGKGTNTRYVTNILPENEPADSLLVVEVITPGGHTSSYPPHKHDQDNLPAESYLEETYYHRFNPPPGLWLPAGLYG